MSRFITFYANQIYEQSDSWINSYDLPDGAYQVSLWGNVSNWYLIRPGNTQPINLCDVPKEIRMLCLILGIQA